MLVDAAARARRQARVRRHQHPRHLGRPRPGPSSAASRSPTRRSTTPTARRCWPSRARSARARSRAPSSSTARAGSPRASSGAIPSSTHPRRPGRRTVAARGPPMGEWFQRARLLVGLAGARRPGRAGRRPGVVLLPVRDPAAAGLPLLRHRALRRRPRGRRGDPRAAGCSLGSLLFVLGFSVVFVAARDACPAPLGAWLRHLAAASSPSCSASSRSCSAWRSSGWCRSLQRDVRVHEVPAVGLAAAPLLGFLFGLGWTPCIGPTLGVISTLALNEGTAARGALLSAVYALGLGLPVHRRRARLRAACSARSRFVRRHQVWVTRIGGLMLIAVGAAAGHRLVGPSASPGSRSSWSTASR